MFIYKSRFLIRGEAWYDEAANGSRVDWIWHRQRSSPLATYRWKPFFTRLIDLRQTPNELMAAMEAKTVRKIVQAQDQDRLSCERYVVKDSTTMDEVERMWNEFATAQHTPLFERDWVDPMGKAGRLELSAARDSFGQVLAYHLVFLTPKRARQMFAISPYRAVPDVAWRNAVSRANCFVHWCNFLTFHAQGIAYFDFGGWYTGTTDMKYLGINRFKQSFGGRIIQEYDCEQPVTVKGWVLLTVAHLLARARQAPTRQTRTGGSPKPAPKPHATLPEEQKVSPAVR